MDLDATLSQYERAGDRLARARRRWATAYDRPEPAADAAGLRTAEITFTAASDHLLAALRAVERAGCQHCQLAARGLACLVQARRQPVGWSPALDGRTAPRIAALRAAHDGLPCPRPGLHAVPSGPDRRPL